MSGHSKWSKIKRDKAANDAKRGAVFTKAGNQIAIAARGGTNPDTNSALAMAIEAAKSVNMPQANIKRAIQRAADKSKNQVEEVVYEGYGHGGVAILIKAATDNRKRTYPEVRSTLSKYGGRIADPGSVSFNFNHCGQIIIEVVDKDQATLDAIEAGAIDAEEQGDNQVVVTTKVVDFHNIRQKLKESDHKVVEANITYIPKTTISLDETQQQKLLKLFDQLDDLDDVLEIYSNLAD